MNPSRLFILRPVATSLLMLAILLAGAIAYKQLPLSALPEVDYPTIQVVTLYPGASPDVMTSSVTAPLERQFGQMPGLQRMTSTSSGGAAVVTLQFNLDLSLDIAEQQVQAAINAAANLLPDELPSPPIYSKINPADAPILTIAIASKTLPLPQVEDLVDTRIAQKLSQVPGVGLVSINGGQRPAVRIQVNPTALAAYGLAIEDVRSAVNNANSNQAKGNFDGPTRASTIDANDQLRSAQEYRDLVLAYRDGAPIRLSDVATTVDGAENNRLAAWADRTPAIVLNIQRQPGANVIDVVDRIQQLLPELRAALPAAVDVAVLTDRTITIRASLRDVQFELALAVALVVMVIFIFLRNIPATIIPSFAVPLSIVGTFGVMYLAGFSLNNLTLMALTISTGFVVDDAIVVIENISRYLEKNANGERALSPLEAALKGSKQIAFTIISLTLSLIAVLIPLLFMGDVVGRLFREFAITLAVAILISGVVSLTLTPMLCAKMLRPLREDEQSRLYRVTGEWFDRLVAKYGQWLHWVLAHQRATLAVVIASIALTVALAASVAKGFFPVQDTGVIQAVSEAPQTISFQAMAERQQQLADIILRDAAVQSLSSFIGVDGTNAALNNGRMLINLKPHGERDDVQSVMRRLQPELARVAGITLYMQPVQDLTIDDRASRTQYQLSVQDLSGAELAQWVPKLIAAMRELPELADVTSDYQNEGLEAYLHIDRATASRLGVTVAAINSTLYNAFGQRLISTIFTQSNQYRVVLEAAPEFQRGPEAILDLHVPSSGGAQVPMRAFARVQERTAPLVIHHEEQFPAATISFNLAPGIALGAAVEAIDNLRAQLQIPPSVQTRFVGAALAFRAALDNELWLIIAAIVTMYIVLGVLYESYIHPITILSTLPSAGIGALLALIVSGNDLNIIAIIGVVLLIGIVKKNAIMMIDFALEAEREHGKAPFDAIYEACLLRFRPILMTTMAALLGALPLMLGSGVGAELRNPLGITMVGGLLVSQVMTLFTTPVIYLAFDRLGRRFSQRQWRWSDAE